MAEPSAGSISARPRGASRWTGALTSAMGGCGGVRMDRETAIASLRRHADELRAEGVATLYLFGSTARDEAREASDVDLFFDYDNPKFSLVELVRVKDRIKAILGVEADVMTRDSLHPLLKERIEASAFRVF
ncbi:MAG: nucleotidyltransferase family protein [Geminicoccales bacterium]